MKGRSSFVIAHRLSTILNADMIIVMNKGEIESIGTHKEILKTSPIYKKLFEMQFNSNV
jgi:ABC-type multidrug transport system fused ATPase/permease subunit